MGAFVFALPDLAQAASGRITVESGGVTRSAYLVEHERLKRGIRPTIVVLHGAGGSGLRTRRTLGLEDVIRSQGVVVVYPNAADGKTSAADGKWDETPAGGERDAQFVRDLIAKLVNDGITDKRRVYLAGVSSGGMLAIRLACEHADTFAAVGALIAGMPASVAASCKPDKPLPFALIAGTGDPFVPFNGGTASLRDYKQPIESAEATLAPFKTAAGCKDEKTTTDVPDRDPNDGSRVFIDTYKDCKAPVELVRVEGGGHSIPSRWANQDRGIPVGAHNNDIDGARVIWDFFKRAGA